MNGLISDRQRKWKNSIVILLFSMIIGEKTRISQFRRKTYAISWFLALFLPVPIWPKEPISQKLRERLSLKLEITLCASWMSWYFTIKFTKSTFFNLHLIAFGRVRKFTNFDILLHSNIVKHLIKLKIFSNYDFMLNAPAVNHFWTKKIFLSPYRWKCQISPNFWWKKFWAILSLPLNTFIHLNQI